MSSYVVGVDLGATWLRAVLADEEGHFITRREERTVAREGAVEDQLIGIVRAVLSRAGVEKPRAIGVGAIGPVDLWAGAVVRPPNLPVERIEIARALHTAFGAPVYVLNDCTTACYGEAIFGAGKGLSNTAFVAIGTGIGGGAMIDGHLLLGKSGNAAEVGHFVVDVQGRMRCTCGAYGHWEAYCSGAMIPSFFRRWALEKGLGEHELSGLFEKELPAITAKDVLEACRKEEELLAGFLEELVKLNAAGLANVINAFNPALISVGGSVALGNFDILIRPAISLLASYAFNEVPEIIPSPLGHDAGLYGAVALALRPPAILLERALYARTR